VDVKLIVMLVVFGTLSLVLYFVFNRREYSFIDFSAAGRNTGPWFLFASIAATFVGPGMSIGLVGSGYESGLLYFFLSLGYVVQLIWLGLFVVPRLHVSAPEALSPGDIIRGTRTGKIASLIQIGAGVFTLLILVGVTSIMARAGGQLIAELFGVDRHIGATALTLLVMAYTVKGGLTTSIATDVLQFIVFVIVFMALGLAVCVRPDLDGSRYVLTAYKLTAGSLETNTFSALLAISLALSLGDILQPPFVSRIQAAKSQLIGRNAFVAAGLFAMVWVLAMVSLGIAARTIGVSSTSPDDVLVAFGRAVLSEPFRILLVVAILCIVISSHDSLLNSASTVFTRDIFSQVILLYGENRQLLATELLISRLAVVFFGFIALAIATIDLRIISTLLFLANIWAPTMLVPLVGSIWLPSDKSMAPAYAMAAGGVAASTWGVVGTGSPLPPILVGLIISAVIWAGTVFVYGRTIIKAVKEP
jgi:solute:Na+ symporter, SSS family